MSSIIPPIAPTLALNFEQCRNNADAAAMIKRYGLVFGRATTGWSMDRRGTLIQAAINEPRVDFSDVGVNRGYISEPLAANIALRSQELNDAYWGATAANISPNSSTAPDVATTADTMTENAGIVDPRLPRAITFVAGTNYTLSVFAKVKPGSAQRYLMLVYNSGYANVHGVNFNLVAGTVGATFNASGTITALPDGWYRVSMTPNANATGTGSLRIRISNVDTSGNINVPTSYTGDGTSGFILWQSEIKAGPIADSIIPTTTTSLSRSPDILTGTGISSLIGQSEFNILAKVDTRSYNNGSSRVIADIREDANNYAQLRKTTGGAFEFELVAGGVQQALITDPTGSREGVFRIGARAKANDFKLFVSGASVGTPDVSGTVPTLSKLGVGHAIDGSLNASNWFGDRVGQLYLYNRGLSDAVNLNATRQV